MKPAPAPTRSPFLPEKTWQRLLAAFLGLSLIFIFVWLIIGIWESFEGKSFSEAIFSVGEFVLVICGLILYWVAAGGVAWFSDWVLSETKLGHLINAGYKRLAKLVVTAIIWGIIAVVLYGIMAWFMSLRPSSIFIVILLILILSNINRRN